MFILHVRVEDNRLNKNLFFSLIFILFSFYFILGGLRVRVSVTSHITVKNCHTVTLSHVIRKNGKRF